VVVVALVLMLIYIKRTQHPAILPEVLDSTPRAPEEVVLPTISTRWSEAVQTKPQSPLPFMTDSSPKSAEGMPKFSEAQPVRTIGLAGSIHWLSDSEAKQMPVNDLLSKAKVKSKESFEPRPVKTTEKLCKARDLRVVRHEQGLEYQEINESDPAALSRAQRRTGLSTRESIPLVLIGRQHPGKRQSPGKHLVELGANGADGA